MIETTLPLAPELQPKLPAPDHAPLLGQLATLRRENAALRALPVEQVDELVAVKTERGRHCQQPFPEPAGRRRGRAWRHQVV